MIITASIVTYKTDHDELKKCIDSMRKNGIAPIYISDNSPSDELREFCSLLDGVEYIFNNANMGYGPGHNVAIKKAQEIHADYHLVINSDVYFDEGVIAKITEYMEANKDVAQLQPMLRYPDGRLQLTTRLLPTPFDLIFRRFMPKKMGEKMNYRYTLEFWDHKLLQTSHIIREVSCSSACLHLIRWDCLMSDTSCILRTLILPEECISIIAQCIGQWCRWCMLIEQHLIRVRKC